MERHKKKKKFTGIVSSKKRLLSLILLVLTLFVIGSSETMFAYAPAPPIPRQVAPPNVIPYNNDNLIVSISSPANQTYETHNVTLNLTVAKPSSWNNATFNGTREYEGRINYLDYNIDGQTRQLPVLDIDDWNSMIPVIFSINLTDLKDGVHQVTAKASGICVFAPAFFNGRYSNQIQGTSEKINFTINAPPIVDLLSPENMTYTQNNFPLIFTVDENVSGIAYSLNHEGNISINGNTTLTGLKDGIQSIQIYAQVITGNIGNSKLVNFVVSVPPEIELISPRDCAYNSTSVPITFTINKPTLWIGYSLDGEQVVAVSGNTTLSDLASGNHTLTIYAEDTAKNNGTSQTINFARYPEIAPPPPPEATLTKIGTLLNTGIALTLVISAVFAIVRLRRKKAVLIPKERTAKAT